LQEGDVHVIDEAWEEEHRRRAYVEGTTGLGVDFAQLDAEMQAKDPRYSACDVYWAAANRAVLAALKAGDRTRASEVYFRMAMMAYDESDEDQESGRAMELKRRAHLATLRTYAADFDAVDIVACDCGTCCRGRNVGLAIEDELAAPSIPHVGCERGWCSCDYVAQIN
jgi:hypothetical protein